MGHIPITKLHANGLPVETTNPLPVVTVYTRDAGDWDIETVTDTAANDNDKTLTVPADEEWQILTVYVVYTSDANAGDRQLQILCYTDVGLVVGDYRPNEVQAASLQRRYMFGPSLANLTDFYDTNYLQTPIPPTVFLRPGYQIRVFDNNGVSANDTMEIYLSYAKRDVV